MPQSINAALYDLQNDTSDEVAIIELSQTIARVGDYTYYAELDPQTMQYIEAFVRRVFAEGYQESFLNMTDQQKVDLFKRCKRLTSLKFYMALYSLNGVVPKQFTADKNLSFDNFREMLSSEFTDSFEDLGSEYFQSRLHQYFVIHGLDLDASYKTKNNLIPRGRHDELMAHTALVLKDIYGEEKISKLVDCITEQTPRRSEYDDGSGYPLYDPMTLYALDIFLLVESGVDYSELPLHWAICLVQDTWPDEVR